jgi:hypothetical protein
MKSTGYTRPLLWILLLNAACTFFQSGAAADMATDQAKLSQLLKGSGYQFTQKTDSVWAIDLDGKSLGNYKLIGASEQGMLVMFVIIATKAELNLNQDLAYKMLKLNHEFDRVKVGIDDDGDAFVRVDLSIRTLDEEEFKLNVEQVANSADEAYADIKPYLRQQP